MAPASFTVDGETMMLIERLRDMFGAQTHAEVVRRALALAKIAARHAGPDRQIRICGTDPSDREETILLAE